MGQGNLQEMPVKITKTVVDSAEDSKSKRFGATDNQPAV